MPARAQWRAPLARSKSTERIGGTITIALHAIVGAALLGYEPTRSALFAAAPIMVNLIAPQAPPEPEPPLEVPPPPKPVMKPLPKPPQPLPIVAAPLEAPSPIVAPPPTPPEPTPIAEAPPAPIAVTPPIFSADYLDNPPPRYPGLSRRLGEQGRVVLRVLVNAAGTADEVQIRTSSGHARLDEAARETVQRWRFVAARRGAQPIAAWVLIPVSFRLEG